MASHSFVPMTADFTEVVVIFLNTAAVYSSAAVPANVTCCCWALSIESLAEPTEYSKRA